MPLPKNKFKAALLERRHQLGLWCTLCDAYAAEIVAGSGFDWLMFDTEHSPADIRTVLSQLQAVAAYDLSSIVRLVSNDVSLIKRYLDIGAQTLLIPFVQSPEEAEQAVLAMRYPPDGIRGVSAVTRATRFGRVRDYPRGAGEEMCLLVQIETQSALDKLEQIAAVEGVDGIFIGPADLAASLGYVGNPGHPFVRKAIEEAAERIRAFGKPVGILTPDIEFAKRMVSLGSTFTAIGVDAAILARTTENLAAEFRISFP